MALPQWMRNIAAITKKAAISAACYFLGICLYRSVVDHSMPGWKDLPSILESWIVFSAVCYLLEWWRRRRTERDDPEPPSAVRVS
jgi:hypothetical protein